jgi:hypothetical protein
MLLKTPALMVVWTIKYIIPPTIISERRNFCERFMALAKIIF